MVAGQEDPLIIVRSNLRHAWNKSNNKKPCKIAEIMKKGFCRQVSFSKMLIAVLFDLLKLWFFFYKCVVPLEEKDHDFWKLEILI